MKETQNRQKSSQNRSKKITILGECFWERVDRVIICKKCKRI